MSEELIQQQLWLGTVVVLGSAVAAGEHCSHKLDRNVSSWRCKADHCSKEE